jgi:uncharacterized protein (TIGR02596 family)
MNASSRKIRAFSLLELIVVIMIIGIIAAFTLPAASTILRGSQITQASQIITDQVSLARQTALTKNRSVEVRLISYVDPEVPGDTGAYRAIQVMEILENGIAVPTDKPRLLPQAVIMNMGTLSTLISGTGQTSTTASGSAPNLPRNIGQNYTYVAFRFLPDGSTNLSASSLWYVTLHNMNETVTGTTTPANFFTLQVDPVTGKVKQYRPSV